MARQCRRCHVTYPDDLEPSAFRARKRRGYTLARRGYVCYPCARTSQDDRKRSNRWISKARSTIAHHADSRKPPISRDDLVRIYGWNPDRMARDMAAVYADGLGLCGECGEPYGLMGHGPSDVTLDICRPDDDPYYGTNTRYICMTDNREKHALPPGEWQLRKRVWAWWKSHKDLSPEDLGLLF